ncbi:hypothetical protein BJF90_44800 [Pseudonocardia sp. CNS-004]|nr:hypothetical protein BJF90_44800 [Pseudonocardia sp. CNS-004]
MANAARTAATELKDYSNVIFNVYNEPDLSDSRTDEDDLAEYLDAVREAAPGRLVGTGTKDTGDSAEIADLDQVDVLMHDAGFTGDEAIDAFEELKGETSKPIINIESFGGAGQGFQDDATMSVAAPEATTSTSGTGDASSARCPTRTTRPRTARLPGRTPTGG